MQEPLHFGLLARVARFVAVAGLLFATAAFAVCMKNDYSVRREYSDSSAVFLGTPVSVKHVPAHRDFFEGTTYRVSVDRIFHGKLPQKTLDIFSENSTGRFPMKIGVQYLLFVYRDLGRTMVDNCGNSGPVAEKASVLKEVQEIQRQQAASNSSTP